jgi:hypothetical protein
MADQYPDFFETSPFSLVADEEAAQCWSGRNEVHKSLEELKQTLLRRADSSLDVVWANLGAGKTHTLFHFAYLLQNDRQSRSLPVFLEMPEQVRNFVDIYKRIAAALPVDRLAEILVNAPSGKLPGNLERAGTVLKHGTAKEKGTVHSWLCAERPFISELRACSGIGERIEDDLAATEMLQGVVRAFDIAKCRLVLLIDEFQRVGLVKPTVRNRILSSLRTVFSRSPRYFSTVIAVQSQVEKSALELVPPELKTLIGRKPTISLPEMDSNEATEFILGRFRFFRPSGYVGNETAPFDRNAISSILGYMTEEAGIPLNPREILQAFASVYDRTADLSCLITRSHALNVMKKVYDHKE